MVNFETLGSSLTLNNKQFIAACLESAGVSKATSTAIMADWAMIATVLAIVVGGFVAVTKVLSDASAEAAASEPIWANLNNTLYNTGRISEVSAAEVEAFLNSLAGSSKFDDEGLAQAYTIIARYKNVPTAEIKEFMYAAMDMAAATGKTVPEAMEAIMKAHNTGRYAQVGFTAAMRDEIKAAQDAGDQAKVTALEQQFLNQLYGGASVSALNTLTGKQAYWNNILGECNEILGTVVNAGLKGLLDGLTSIFGPADHIIAKFKSMVESLYLLVNAAIWANQALAAIASNPLLLLNPEALKDAFSNMWQKWQDDFDNLFKGTEIAGQGVAEFGDEFVKAGNKGSDALDKLKAKIRELQQAITHFNEAELSFFMEEIKYFADTKSSLADVAAAQKKYYDDYEISRLSLMEQEKVWNMQLQGLLKQGATDEANALEVRIAQEKAALAQKALEEKKANQKSIDDARKAQEEVAKAHKQSINQMIVDLVKYQLMRDGVFSNADFNVIIKLMQSLGMISADETAQALADWQYAMGLVTQFGGTLENPVANMDYPQLPSGNGVGGGRSNGSTLSYGDLSKVDITSFGDMSDVQRWGKWGPFRIPMFANGGTLNPSIPSLVGERGPELAYQNQITPLTGGKSREVELGQKTINKFVSALLKGNA